jgi:hypothetical protein
MPRGYSQNKGEIFPYKKKWRNVSSPFRLISRMRMRRLIRDRSVCLPLELRLVLGGWADGVVTVEDEEVEESAL